MDARKRRTKPLERVSGLQSEKDRCGALEVLGRAFNNPAMIEQHVGRSLWQPPIFDPEHTRVGVVDGRVVAVVVMGPRTIRFGPVGVPAMTIGPLGTHDHYRRRGYMAATMNDASGYMKRSGVLVAYLQGIGDFYYRFGYYPYMARSDVRFQREEACRQAQPGRLRAMRRDDLGRMRRLYDTAARWRMCAGVRDDRVWDWLWSAGRRSWMFGRPRLVLDARGRLHGYLTLRPGKELQVREIVVRDDEQSCRVTLGAIAREAKRREVKEIILPLAWDDPLSLFLRQYVGAEFRMYPHPTGGALMKVVDFLALMRRLEPLFDRRWKEAGRALGKVRFVLESEVGAVGIEVGARRTGAGVRVREPAGEPAVRRVRIPQRWLSGLLTGYYTPRDVAPRKGARIPAALMPVMEVLFPPRWPWVYQAENY